MFCVMISLIIYDLGGSRMGNGIVEPVQDHGIEIPGDFRVSIPCMLVRLWTPVLSDEDGDHMPITVHGPTDEILKAADTVPE